MLEVKGDLWTYPADAKCITTNGITNRYGEAVMGRGVASQAKNRYPNFAAEFGRALRQGGNQVYYWPSAALFTFPVKHHWGERADVELIITSCRQLIYLLDIHTEMQCVLLPKPGCGNGGLLWWDVQLIIELLLDDRVVIIDL